MRFQLHCISVIKYVVKISVQYKNSLIMFYIELDRLNVSI